MAVAIILLERPTHADRTAVFVEVSYFAGLELGDTWATLVDHEQRENVLAGDRVRDALDVLS